MKKNKAFSLVEVSIVIIIIGIILVGVAKSMAFFNKAGLKVKQRITRNAPMMSTKIPDLVLWHETTLEESITMDSSNKVSKWHDIKPNAYGAAKDATQSDEARKPIFIENSLGTGLPALSFPRGNRFDTTLNELVGSDYTIFVVASKGPTGYQLYLFGTGRATHTNLHVGFRSNHQLIHGHFNDDINYANSEHKVIEGSPHIFTFHFDQSAGTKSIWINGSDKNLTGYYKSHADTTPVTSYPEPKIGNRDDLDEGIIPAFAELIIFAHALNVTERRSVEKYLSQKYNIELN